MLGILVVARSVSVEDSSWLCARRSPLCACRLMLGHWHTDGVYRWVKQLMEVCALRHVLETPETGGPPDATAPSYPRYPRLSRHGAHGASTRPDLRRIATPRLLLSATLLHGVYEGRCEHAKRESLFLRRETQRSSLRCVRPCGSVMISQSIPIGSKTLDTFRIEP